MTGHCGLRACGHAGSRLTRGEVRVVNHFFRSGGQL